jgi:hypothetical protein
MPSQRKSYFHSRHGLIKVKQGFSWPAFWFGSLWAAAMQMWLPAFLLLLVVDIWLWFITGYAQAQGAAGLALLGLIATVVYAYVRGRYGNRWLASSLVKRGYVPEDT